MTNIKILFYPNYNDIENEIQYALSNNTISLDKIKKENNIITGMIFGTSEWFFIDLNNLYVCIDTLNILSLKYNICKIFYYNKLKSNDLIYSKIFEYIIEKCKLSNLNIYTLLFLFDNSSDFFNNTNKSKSSYIEKFISYFI